PGSRAQRDTVHGASVVIDPGAYAWSDAGWVRPRFRDLVIYEAHVGTFTPEGTFRAAIAKLPYLRSLGVMALELMPIGDFAGSRNWGYDGVLLYAPARAYGRPDDLRALVDAAHGQGLAVILDVMYNHLGPDGNYLAQYSGAFFNDSHHTPWGAALNFDGESCAAVREFFIANPIYWMEEFHIDGFRLDATHAIIDESEPHILSEIAAAIHGQGGYAIAEDERNEARLLLGTQGCGYNFDGVWADDFHHVVRVGQTGQREAYFQNFEGSIDEVVDTLRHGWLYRGQRSRVTGHPRGTACRQLPPSKFIHCISNHDQAGNRAFGERINASIGPEAYRALSMLLCLTPYTPMLFMGQEWAASTPFLYFTDHHAELGTLITAGRRREFKDFPGFSDLAALQQIPDPQDTQTFGNSKLHWSELHEGLHARVLLLYAECLRMRAANPALRPESRETWAVERLGFGVGAVRFDERAASHLLIFDPAGSHAGHLRDEVVAALPAGHRWERVLSSNEERFGGTGAHSFHEDIQSCEFRGPETVLLRET
nr:malto-oligosyltrehalose trehalohydrolase [Verrucomicrobiota bacterium]